MFQLQQYILGSPQASSTTSSLAFNGNGTASSSAAATPVASGWLLFRTVNIFLYLIFF